MNFKDELMNLLKEELEVLKALKELTYDKTDVIVENQIEKLQEIIKKEEELINKMAIKEEERLNLLYNWGINKNTPLSQVVEKLPEGKEELMDLGEDLSNLLEEIKIRNDLNGQLIEENLQWLDFNINLLTNATTPATYDKGKKGREVKNKLFDRKV